MADKSKPVALTPTIHTLTQQLAYEEGVTPEGKESHEGFVCTLLWLAAHDPGTVAQARALRQQLGLFGAGAEIMHSKGW